MRARADAEIVAVAPVSEVVAALFAGAGVDRDFVGGQAGGGGEGAGGLEQVGAVIGIVGWLIKAAIALLVVFLIFKGIGAARSDRKTRSTDMTRV